MLGFMWKKNSNLQSDTSMDLLEYQAKELFRSIGIPVLASQRIDRIQDLKHLSIPYPIVLKSQVHVGGRGRLGGIRFVETTIDAIAAAQALFNLSIMGEKPTALLAEKKFQTDREFYLAVTLNRSLRRLVLLGSTQGGNEVRSAIDSTQQVVVEGDFSPFYARRLALKMGLEGPLMTAVSLVVEKMYYLLVEKDLDLVEINPLGVSNSDEVMALDGKVTVNDGAIGRHPDLLAFDSQPINPPQTTDDLSWFEAPELSVQSTLETRGIVGILCNGSGLTMATMDSFYQAGGKPIAFLNIGSETHHNWDVQTFCDRLLQGLEAMSQKPQVEVILLNLISGIVSGEAIAQTLLKFLQVKTRSSSPSYATEGVLPANTALNPSKALPLITVRWIGPDGDRAKDLLMGGPVILCDELDFAIGQALKWAKLNKSRF
jgi:succinyl-CoA synthetase beta subunit